jgi:hypothetical protein
MCNRTIGNLGDRRILAVVAVIALLFVWVVPGFAEPQNSGGVYKVTMSNPGTMGLKSDCNTEGYVLASYNHGTLEADGYLLDNVAGGGWRVPLDLDLLTGDPGVSWTRQYDAGRGKSGVFNGCYGETLPQPPPGNVGCYGRLWIMFETTKGSTVTFLWNFDCYEAQGSKKNQTIREHFSMRSEPISFPAWTGGDISGRVQGTFDVRYYLNGTLVRSLTGGLGRHFDFDLGIKKLPLP